MVVLGFDFNEVASYLQSDRLFLVLQDPDSLVVGGLGQVDTGNAETKMLLC